MNDIWFRSLVWTDYRLAVLLTVILPIILLIWSLARGIESISKLLVIYWRVASLLMITVYLMIPAWPISFITSFASRVLIPISLWFWVDLNDEIKDLPQSSLKMALTSWRWAITIYSTLGAIATIPFLPCGFEQEVAENQFCRVWLEAPWRFREMFHPTTEQEVLGFFGLLGLMIYLLYFVYFIFIRLPKQGRIALEQ
ncbi:conserved hypothetical protein [Gloeothece citriformis PCC 7424]|uniref:Uncharacterized protein n=1 Tax=Gloeothece citriformis (strain PCC 7424) TaxID=65393 RepID=B7KL77_GLOC7|nr:DUF3177 family protein [Gloeothece citriformis]ACK72449.1 conserved hypothetical protein [Gloeothece citriformis PCC 7424]